MRPTRVYIDPKALLHNIAVIKKFTNNRPIIAMVKANAYGCGLEHIVPYLEDKVYAYGVASLEEALAIRRMGYNKPCILFQGVFDAADFKVASSNNFQIVLHQAHHLNWISQCNSKIKVWIKINTGMNRLGFMPQEIPAIISKLRDLKCIDETIGLISHFSCADEISNPHNAEQIATFNAINLPKGRYLKSLANSAAILTLPESHADVVRPGIMLYGVSPFVEGRGLSHGLAPVMHFYSKIVAINNYSKNTAIGYGLTYTCKQNSRIGIIPVGYGDGYPRHITNGQVYAKNHLLPIVGKISMDMMAIDLTSCNHIGLNDDIELWGRNISIEEVAKRANTIAYELLTQVTRRGFN